MSFGELLTAPQVWPFSLALLLFFAASIMEIILAFTGFGADLGLDLSLDLDAPDPSGFLRFFDWLGIGRVPYLISLAAFLLGFGIAGLFAQTIQLETVGAALPWPIVAVGCALISLPFVRVLNRGLGRIWPKDVESSAVTYESLIGHEAEVVLGEVRNDSPGQIKIRDPEGSTHYGLAVSDTTGESFATGERLLVVGRRGAIYTVIRHPNPSSPDTSSPSSAS